jgi:hypothetical protein
VRDIKKIVVAIEYPEFAPVSPVAISSRNSFPSLLIANSHCLCRDLHRQWSVAYTENQPMVIYPVKRNHVSLFVTGHNFGFNLSTSMIARTKRSFAPAASIAMFLPSGENITLEICELLKKFSTGIGLFCA